jgi:putative transcriptional regulator
MNATDRTLAAGVLIQSTPALDDTVFAGVTILLTEYNEKGAMGFVVNKPFGRALNELVEFSQVPYFPLYRGGPVDEDHLYFIHNRLDLIPDGIRVVNELYAGGEFSQVVKGIQQQQLNTEEVKIFVGYCGWDGGELEAEIAEGSWRLHPVSNGTPAVLLSAVFHK